MKSEQKTFREQIGDFQGLGLDVHKARLPDEKFTVDEGGDHFGQGRWKVRRGRKHTDIAAVSDPVVSILAFERPGGDVAEIFAASTNAYGETNVGVQGTGDDEAGFGEGGFGVGGFGQ